MPKAYVSIAAFAAFAGTFPAFAAAQGQAPRAAPSAQAAPTRATTVKNLDGNFKAIDTNSDGTLSAEELGVAESNVQQKRLTQIRAQYETNFAKLDTNKDGQLSKTEFMVAAPSKPTPANGAKVLTQIDKNKDGKASADEYRAPVLARFDALDTNKDGTISPAERQAAEARNPKR